MANVRCAPVRVGFQQPALPAYRVPLFRAIARLPNIRFELLHGSEEPELENAAADGFVASLVQFYPLPSRHSRWLFWHSAHWSLVNRRKADIVVLSWNIRYLSLWAALIKARILGVPTALWGHGYSKQSSNSLRDRLRNVPIVLARAVILYDEKTREKLIKAGYSPEKIHVASNGLDGARIATAREFALAEKLNGDVSREPKAGQAPALIYIGRLEYKNRLDIALGAMKRLSVRYPAISLVVIGDGAAELERLKSIAVDLGVAERVSWVGGLYDELEVAKRMVAADVFVYPCNVGLSLIHAMNYAVPAVVCGPLTSHNPEISVLRHGLNGRVAKQADEQSLADEIQTLWSCRKQHEQMRLAALESVKHVHNIDSMASSFAGLFAYLDKYRRAR